MAGSKRSYYVISSANSMKLGILQIDLDLAIFQRTAVGFLIIGLLYYAQDYQGFLYLRYSGSSIAQPRHPQFYCTATASAVLFGIVRRFIQPEVQRISIF